MSQETIVKCSLNDEKYLTSINSENHQFYVDEPHEYGGDDLAPKPTEYLLGSLGACTAITMKMYAERKQWKLGKINVSIELKKSVNKSENTILKQVSFQEKLSPDKIEKLLKIGEKCPVSKMLAFPVKMELINKI